MESPAIQTVLAERRRASVARALRLTSQEDPPIEYVHAPAVVPVTGRSPADSLLVKPKTLA